MGLSKYAKTGAWNDPDMLEVRPFQVLLQAGHHVGVCPGTDLCETLWLREQVGNTGLSEQVRPSFSCLQAGCM